MARQLSDGLAMPTLRASITPTEPSMTSPTVLILGANGRFGAAAVQAFAAAGWRVLAQVRRTSVSPSPARVETLDIPLSDTAALAARAAGASTVVHAINPLYARWDAEALPLFRLGLDVAEQLGATFMLPGNVYNFGERMPPRLMPDTPEQPTTTKGRQRAAMEAELRTRTARGLNGVVIRAGDFFGAGRGSWLDLVIAKDVAKGKLAYPGPLDVPHAWAYLPDLARTFVAVANKAPRGFTRLHFEGHTLTGRELLTHLESAADSLGLRPQKGWRHGAMPWGVIRAVGTLYPLWRELARMSYLWRVPHALDGGALEALVGALPATAPVAALRRSLIDLGHGHSAADAPRLAT
jgi:nucleoside-diphosphate-sugar epimerase